MKMWTYLGQITLSKNCKICPFTIPNQTPHDMHTPSLVKILKLLSGNENMDRRTTDGGTHGQPM